MGFRTGAYAKVWQVDTKSDTMTALRVSVSKKNKETNTYEQDFSGFVTAVGTATAAKAARLQEGDTIRFGDVDVKTKYNKEKGVTYTNYYVYSFDKDLDEKSDAPKKKQEPAVDSGEIDDSEGHDLPF